MAGWRSSSTRRPPSGGGGSGSGAPPPPPPPGRRPERPAAKSPPQAPRPAPNSGKQISARRYPAEVAATLISNWYRAGLYMLGRGRCAPPRVHTGGARFGEAQQEG